ncbi:uncharacterized protein DUF397 [Haloactinospora alba]|uniref:Uncharacterized protein DUF397 n=1 Tax=Haloactinospora alba TaxID=405555 RepID=A0A543N6X0_9ACTN|nr:DUF397 domain-containing protein [Haloactinospora alba]TQN27585.1 uncharacterized protein DUF397 [Haloactinospora alba]
MRHAPHWRKSSYSAPRSNNCVEIANPRQDVAAVRDSQNTNLEHLAFSGNEWAAFLRVLRDETL